MAESVKGLIVGMCVAGILTILCVLVVWHSSKKDAECVKKPDKNDQEIKDCSRWRMAIPASFLVGLLCLATTIAIGISIVVKLKRA